MKPFIIRFAELLRMLLPLQIFYIFLCCIGCVWFQTDINMAALLIIGGSVIFVSSAAAAAFGEVVSREKSPSKRLIGDCFKGISRTSRLFFAGVEELSSGSFNEALSDLQEVEEQDISERERAVLCFYIGNCYRYMGYPTNAAAYYVKSIENNINEDFVSILAARCYVSNGSFSCAMNMYQSLLDKNSHFEYIYTDMGMCCLKSQDPDKALEYFLKSIEKGKNYSFALGGCSLACLMKKDVEKSKEYYAKALINNLNDIEGFRRYYCSIAEAAGCFDLIDDHMKILTPEVRERNDFTPFS